MAVLDIFEFRVHQLCRVSQPLDQTLPVVGLIAKDSRVSVLAFVGLGYGCRLTVARAFRNLARHAVPRDDSEKRISDEDILERNFHVVATAGTAPVVERDKGSESCVNRT